MQRRQQDQAGDGETEDQIKEKLWIALVKNLGFDVERVLLGL